MGYYDKFLMHEDKRDKGMNSTSNEKGTDNKKNNTSEYNHDYYMKNKEKWQDNKSSKSSDDDTVKELSDMSGMKEEECRKLLELAKTKGYDDPEYKDLLDSLSEGDPKEYERMEAVVKKNVGSSNSGEKEFDVDAAAKDVIRGKYGNGADRRAALGDDYAAVQRRVDEMMKGDSAKHSEEDDMYEDEVYEDEEYEDQLEHHGIKGQHWGVRRFETKGGHLTAAGKKRYGEESDLYKKQKGGASSALKAAGNTIAANVYRMNKNVYKNSNKTLSSMNAAAEKKFRNKAEQHAKDMVAKKEAKQAYKAEYKKNLKNIKENATLGEKLTYNSATRRRAAKLMTKYKDVSMEEANKQAKKEAWRNTAILLTAVGAYQVAKISANNKAKNSYTPFSSSTLSQISNFRP